MKSRFLASLEMTAILKERKKRISAAKSPITRFLIPLRSIRNDCPIAPKKGGEVLRRRSRRNTSPPPFSRDAPVISNAVRNLFIPLQVNNFSF